MSAFGGKADMTFNTAEGWARDVTEDIARALLDEARKSRRQLSHQLARSTSGPSERTCRQT